MRLTVSSGTLMTFTALVLGTMAGYGFSRFKFRGNRALSLFMLLGQLIPLIALIVPFFQIFDAVGLLDTKIGIALAHLTTALPLVTWMSASYFSTIPVELDEAAIIDGCTRMQALRKVVLPVALPGIISIALFAFLMSWNEFVLASVLTNTDNSKTLPIGLSEFATMFTVDWGSTMAAAFLMTVPVVAVFFAFQKQFVRGLSAGPLRDEPMCVPRKTLIRGLICKITILLPRSPSAQTPLCLADFNRSLVPGSSSMTASGIPPKCPAVFTWICFGMV